MGHIITPDGLKLTPGLSAAVAKFLLLRMSV